MVNTGTHLNVKTSTTALLITDNKEESSNQSKIVVMKVTKEDEKQCETIREQTEITEHKDSLVNQGHQNWIAPSIKKVSNECIARNETMTTLTVIDEETRMSAESNSRSQTPARNIAIPGIILPYLFLK
jgi:hypothetical protein